MAQGSTTRTKDAPVTQEVTKVVEAVCQKLGADNNEYISSYFTNSVITLVGGNSST